MLFQNIQVFPGCSGNFGLDQVIDICCYVKISIEGVLDFYLDAYDAVVVNSTSLKHDNDHVKYYKLIH